MGAWIETGLQAMGSTLPTSHPTWVRGLKLDTSQGAHHIVKSHPTWVRGLKPLNSAAYVRLKQSHPTWVRGLKLIYSDLQNFLKSRTLRGCVD